jgi:DNA polymerase-3 subunit delta
MAKKKYAYQGSELSDQLKRGAPLAPVYYIFGDDPYQIRELLALIRERVNPAFRDFNLHQVTASEASGDQIAGLAYQLPVMDTCSVVMVRDCQQLQKADWEGVLPYLEKPPADDGISTCLVFVNPNRADQIDSRTKVGKLLKKATVGCLKPFDNKMPQWVRQRSKHHHVTIDSDAIHRLIDLLGTELTALDNALERLSLFLGGKGQITIDVVEQTIAGDRDFNVFELSKWVGQRNLEQALRYLRGILGRGEHPLKLLALLASAFRKLIRARVELDQGAPRGAFDKYIPPQLRFNRDQRVKEFMQQVRMFTLPELHRAFELLQQTDLMLKSTSGLTDALIMERLILELCQLRA